MTKSLQDCQGLTELLLDLIRQRPGMFLGDNKISQLPNFILGYSMGFEIARHLNKQADQYFGDNGFLDWFEKKYNIKKTSYWWTPFLEEAHQDERKALEIFFKYLDEYRKETKK